MFQLKNVLPAIILFICIAGCENEFDEYYARPDWLEGTIYDQLEAEGRFSYFLACVDQAGYDEIIGKTGYFTVFAPNDDAFASFFEEQGVSSISELDTATVNDIVEYAIMTNGYTREQLAAYQSTSDGWEYGEAFRRISRSSGSYTADQVYDGTTGEKLDVYVYNEETKYIPYFIDEFFTTQEISSDDFNVFYPDAEYSGFNILDAPVVETDSAFEIVAENGYIYELNQVNLPLYSLDEYIAIDESGNYSVFKEMLDVMAEGTYDSVIYNSLPVYIKTYDEDLLFAPNDESWLTSGGESYASQTGCWTLFVPENDVMNTFLNDKLLSHYSSLDNIIANRSEILLDFINCHMFSTAIWPSQFSSKTESFGMTVTEDNLTGIYVASNGFFYGVDEILKKNNYFYSVFGEIYLNPDYSMMYNEISVYDASLKNILSSSQLDYTLLLVADTTFEDAGYGYNEVQSTFYETDSPDDDATEKFQTIFYGHIISGDYDDVSGSGFLETYDGDYIKYISNKFYGGGNLEDNDPANVLETITTANNGTVYILDKPVMPATVSAVSNLETPPNSVDYSTFYNYLEASGLISSDAITGIDDDEEYTILVPTTTAINAAGLPDYSSTDSDDLETIEKFVQYHILVGERVFTTANYTGGVETLLVSYNTGKYDVYEEVTVGGSSRAVTITDVAGNVVNVKNTTASNIITSDNAVILQIDAVLQYE